MTWHILIQAMKSWKKRGSTCGHQMGPIFLGGIKQSHCKFVWWFDFVHMKFGGLVFLLPMTPFGIQPKSLQPGWRAKEGVVKSSSHWDTGLWLLGLFFWWGSLEKNVYLEITTQNGGVFVYENHHLKPTRKNRFWNERTGSSCQQDSMPMKPVPTNMPKQQSWTHFFCLRTLGMNRKVGMVTQRHHTLQSRLSFVQRTRSFGRESRETSH